MHVFHQKVLKKSRTNLLVPKLNCYFFEVFENTYLWEKYLVLTKTRAFLRTNLLVPIIVFRFFGKHCWICLREHLVSTSKKQEFPRTNLLVPFVNFHFSEESEEISFLSWKTYVLQFKNCICSILFGQNCMNWILYTLFCR